MFYLLMKISKGVLCRALTNVQPLESLQTIIEIRTQILTYQSLNGL